MTYETTNTMTADWSKAEGIRQRGNMNAMMETMLSAAIVAADLPYGWTAEAGSNLPGEDEDTDDDAADEGVFVRIVSGATSTRPLPPLFVLTWNRFGFDVMGARLLPDHRMLERISQSLRGIGSAHWALAGLCGGGYATALLD